MTSAAVWLLLRLRLLVLPAWILLAVVLALQLPAFTNQSESDVGGMIATGSESVRVEERGVREFGTPLLSRVAVVQRDPKGLSTAAQKRTLALALRIDRHQEPVLHSIAFALPISNTKKLVPSSREHGTTAITYLYYRPGVAPSAQLALAQTYAQRIRAQGDPVTGVTGTIPAREAEFRQIEHALPYVEAATIALIALILLIAFRAVGPPLVTLGAAALSYAISVRLLTWIADALGVQVPREVQPVLVALLLGLTTDYSVFFFSGVKRSLASGERRVRAAEQTTRLFLPIIVTAGLIVAFGSASLIVGRLGFFRALGPGMAVTVLVTLAVAVTVIPATLAIFGRALFWPGLDPEREGESSSRLRHSLGRFATWRPVALVLTIGAAAVLVLGASQARSTVLGLDLLAGLPGSDQVKQAADDAGKGFAPGIVSPTELLVEGRGLRDDQAGLAKLQQRLSARPGIAGVIGAGYQPSQIREPIFVNSAGSAARFALVLDDDPLGAHAIRTLQRLRDDLPGLLSASGLRGARAGLAGDTALADDTVTTIHSDIARVALALLLANFVLLALFLRAVLAPLYLLAASVLALTASIGAATWVFQSLFGYQDLAYYVPFAAAVLLLSLGSDYNIFVVGRIWQEAENRPFREAITHAAPRASRTIAIAGVTLAGSFALLAIIPIRAMRELAFVMSVGVLIDSFLVRSVLVPSLIATFGRISWWPRRPPETQRAAPQLETLEPAESTER